MEQIKFNEDNTQAIIEIDRTDFLWGITNISNAEHELRNRLLSKISAMIPSPYRFSHIIKCIDNPLNFMVTFVVRITRPTEYEESIERWSNLLGIQV